MEAAAMAGAPAILEFQEIPPPFLVRPVHGAAFKLLRLCRILLKYILATPQRMNNLSRLLAYQKLICSPHSTLTVPESGQPSAYSVSQWIYQVQ